MVFGSESEPIWLPSPPLALVATLCRATILLLALFNLAGNDGRWAILRKRWIESQSAESLTREEELRKNYLESIFGLACNSKLKCVIIIGLGQSDKFVGPPQLKVLHFFVVKVENGVGIEKRVESHHFGWVPE